MLENAIDSHGIIYISLHHHLGPERFKRNVNSIMPECTQGHFLKIVKGFKLCQGKTMVKRHNRSDRSVIFDIYILTVQHWTQNAKKRPNFP